MRAVPKKSSRVAETNFLPPLPPTAFARCAAGRSRGGAELGAGVARVGGLDDFACAAERFLRHRTVLPVGQGLRSVHLVEMRFVDFGGGAAFRSAARFVG